MLQKFTMVAADHMAVPNKDVFLSAIEEVERDFGPAMAPPLADALADAILFYVAFHVRGDDRKAMLERAASWYRRSGNKPALGCLLVQEAQVRDLNEAIPLLEQVFRENRGFEPSLCAYAEALYKDNQYMLAYETALEIHRLAQEKWDSWQRSPGSLPTAPMTTAAKALRAEARRLKKAGQRQAAVAVLRRLQEIGQATPKDDRDLERLESMANDAGPNG